MHDATHLALVQLFLELFHCVHSHHVVVQVIRSSVKQEHNKIIMEVTLSFVNLFLFNPIILLKKEKVVTLDTVLPPAGC